MKKIEDCTGLTIAELEEQIQLRQGLINQMVGWLYPSIMQGEIAKLREMIRNFSNHVDAYDRAKKVI